MLENATGDGHEQRTRRHIRKLTYPYSEGENLQFNTTQTEHNPIHFYLNLRTTIQLCWYQLNSASFHDRYSRALPHRGRKSVPCLFRLTSALPCAVLAALCCPALLYIWLVTDQGHRGHRPITNPPAVARQRANALGMARLRTYTLGVARLYTVARLQ